VAGSGLRRKREWTFAREARRRTDRGQAGFLTDIVLSFNRATSEIGHDRLRYGQASCARQEGARIVGADEFRQRTFRCAC
jgi:hypothetical protein